MKWGVLLDLFDINAAPNPFLKVKTSISSIYNAIIDGITETTRQFTLTD